MQLIFNKKDVEEITKNIYFIEEIWTEIDDVYQLLSLSDILDKQSVKRKELFDLENKLAEINKHYNFYIKKNIDLYQKDEKDKIIYFNEKIKKIHSTISNTLEKIC